MHFELNVNKTGHYIFEPSENEMAAAIEIMKNFERLLLHPDSQDWLAGFYLGCGADRIAFDESGNDLAAPGAPAMMIHVDFKDLSGGAFTEMSPEGIHGMLFRGPQSKKLANSMIFAVLWERDRSFKGEVEGVHLPSIQENLQSALGAMEANCQFLIAQEPEVFGRA